MAFAQEEFEAIKEEDRKFICGHYQLIKRLLENHSLNEFLNLSDVKQKEFTKVQDSLKGLKWGQQQVFAFPGENTRVLEGIGTFFVIEGTIGLSMLSAVFLFELMVGAAFSVPSVLLMFSVFGGSLAIGAAFFAVDKLVVARQMSTILKDADSVLSKSDETITLENSQKAMDKLNSEVKPKSKVHKDVVIVSSSSNEPKSFLDRIRFSSMPNLNAKKEQNVEDTNLLHKTIKQQ